MIGSMFRKAWYSDSATLNLDFTTGVLDSRLTFTRSSTATYIDSSGYVASASTDVPRFDHDPSTGAPRGLLIEGQATNLVSNSNLQSGWLGGSNTTVTANTSDVLSPDGTNNAAKVALTSAGYCSRFEAISGLAASTTYTFSYWIRGTAGNQQRVYSVTGSADLVTQSTLTYTSTGWTRVQITFTTGASGPVTVYVYVASRPTGTASDVLYIYGAQVELGTGASSLIPTGASTATRDRDQVTLTNLSSINFSQTEGTCLATVEVREKADSTFLPYGSFDTSGGGRCWWWLRHNLSTVSGTRLLGRAFDSGGSGVLTTANYVYNSGNGGVVKFATSLDTAASSMVFVISGGAPQTTTAAAFTLATAAQWGLNTSTDTVATALGSMWVQSFKYWPTALPSAQLQSLTL